MKHTSWWKRIMDRKVKTHRPRQCRPAVEELEARCVMTAVGFSPIDEVGNNVANPDWGAAPADQPGGAAIQLIRVSPAAYSDGVSTPSLNYKAFDEPSPRTISNDVFNQSPTLYGSPSTDINTVDGNELSDFGYSFGQFMDHDMDLTPDQTGLAVPAGDAAADKDGDDGFPIPADKTNVASAGTDPIGSLAFSRSVYDPTSETTVSITGASWANGVATITAANTFTAGQTVAINGVVPAGYDSPDASLTNGVTTPAAPFTILSANGSSFTYALATNPGTATSFTGAAAATGLRQQTNVITSYLDLSQVYGSSLAVSNALRTFSGGQLKTSPGNMLPYNNATYFSPTAADPDPNQLAELNMSNSGPLPNSELYAAGDVRANENTELTALTTLFVRNHNFIASELQQENPTWTDQQLFQEARKLNIAEYQNIIYTQYLPALLGPDAPVYTGYNPTVNASIATEFSTIAFRFGHSMLNNTVERDANSGASVGNIPLAEDFFDPNLVNPSGAIDPTTGLAGTDIGAFLKGDADSSSQAVDSMVVSSVRDDLFGNGIPGGEDLISRDIWRARDDGIGDYNSVRVAYGLPAITNTSIIETDPVSGTTFVSHGFEQITSNVHVQFELETAYASIITGGGDAGNIDPFVGGMAEDHVPGSDMGPLFTAVLNKQFTNLAVGDQYFYLNESFNFQERAIVAQGLTLGQIITTNTGVTNLQANVFKYDPSVIGVVVTTTPGQFLPQGVAGITVELENAGGAVIATTLTNADGYYSFGQEAAGNYSVVILPPSSDQQVALSPTTVAVTIGARDLDNISAVNFLVGPTATTTSSGTLILDGLFADVDDLANLLKELAV